jgi:TIR domain-containing protein
MTSGARLFPKWRTGWLLIGTAFSAAIVTAAFIPQPAGLSDANGGTRAAFAALVTAALVALPLSPFVGRIGPQRRSVALAVAAIALALGALSFAASGYAQRACTAEYDGKPVIVGTTFTEVGAKYLAANPGLSNDELLFDSAGVPDRLWTRSSIDRCRTLVASTYFLWVPCLAVSLFAVTAALTGRPGLPAIVHDTPAPAKHGAAQIRYDVFISYRHGGADTEFARYLLDALEREGYRVAIDERDFPANASFLLEMERCIRESRSTVAIVSARYMASGHTEEEAVISKVLDMADRKRRLIPVIIQPVTMPAWLYGIVGIDWVSPNPLVDPLEKLKATIGPPLARSA